MILNKNGFSYAVRLVCYITVGVIINGKFAIAVRSSSAYTAEVLLRGARFAPDALEGRSEYSFENDMFDGILIIYIISYLLPIFKMSSKIFFLK